jgi:hypothetical protein
LRCASGLGEADLKQAHVAAGQALFSPSADKVVTQTHSPHTPRFETSLPLPLVRFLLENSTLPGGGTRGCSSLGCHIEQSLIVNLTIL